MGRPGARSHRSPDEGATWRCAGEAVLVVVSGEPGATKLPAGLQPLPGPRVLIASRYASSPVGPYLEVAVAEPARVGPRPGISVTTMAVDSASSCTGGRELWGFPKQLGTLQWSQEGPVRILRWKEQHLSVRWSPTRAGLPALLPCLFLQRRGREAVWAPAIVSGWARPTGLEVAVGGHDDLAFLAGHHRGVHLTGLVLRVGTARALGEDRRWPCGGPGG